MQVRAGCPAARADETDALTLLHFIAGVCQQLLHVRVKGLHAVFVLEKHKIPVCLVVFRVENRPVRYGQNVASGRCVQINA